MIFNAMFLTIAKGAIDIQDSAFNNEVPKGFLISYGGNARVIDKI